MAAADVSPSLANNPVLGGWLRIGSDGVVEVRSGKVELGQGVLTALAQIVADELDVDLSRVRMVAAATDLSPDEGFTAGSRSIQHSGAALRQVCAEARTLYLEVAAAKLAVAADELDVLDGQITGPDGVSTSYWELADDSLLDREATGEVAPKPEADYAVVGTDAARLDLPDKLTGRPRYVHDLALDGQLYGRVVRPPSRGARLRGVDPGPARALPGVVAVVRDGDFLGVVAEREEVALRAADRLRADARWDEQPALPDEDDLPGFLMSARADTAVLASREGPASTRAARSYSARYHRPFLAHGSIGPSSAAALAHPDGRLEVWSQTQGVYQLRHDLAAAFGLAPELVVVRHVEGAGCYGHNGADDAAMDAAVLARTVPGRPVHVVCTWCGRAPTSWRGRRSARRPSSRSAPTAGRTAACWPGATRSGATATWAAPGPPPRTRYWRPATAPAASRSAPAASPRWTGVAAPRETPCPATTFPPSGSPATC
ncbi:hypothetical protein MSAS_40520 [Mycobacterium saskatchewanense]|uniref:molybdopterin cofactor-binding domain-containing protein n=1 Tax=Mycobacterium saskatchewanense TaxID=220927 RepID=UPI00138B4127|nr:molybdopterin cofactor-binding domain-containing protein [Mycobacterium saskatchewanense]BBX64878.1 hypothetical protein MSAS_40520 [Mycobacterium saskatchewanense]